MNAKPVLEVVDLTKTLIHDTRLARGLASVDERTRNKAISSIREWLSQQNESTRVDVEKLWMALYFCFWLTDHNHVQVKCAKGRCLFSKFSCRVGLNS